VRLKHRRDAELQLPPPPPPPRRNGGGALSFASVLLSPSLSLSLSLSFSPSLLRDQQQLDDGGASRDGAADERAPHTKAQVLARGAEAGEGGRRRRGRRRRTRRIAGRRARALPPPPPQQKNEALAFFLRLFFFSFVSTGINEEPGPWREKDALECDDLPRGAAGSGGPKGEAPGRRAFSLCLSPLPSTAAAAAIPNAQGQRVEALRALGSARRSLWRGVSDLLSG
jgi:hypothetical protein